jgi:cholest-4-en-3-one 26-monooxygenase
MENFMQSTPTATGASSTTCGAASGGRIPKIVDLNDSSVFLGGFPHEGVARIRRDYPVYWNEESPDWGPGFWNLTRYEDIVAASRNPEVFSSASGINISYPADADPAIVTAVIGNMICMDPPLHRVYRKIAKPFFTRAWIGALEGRVQELVTGILDKALEKKGLRLHDRRRGPVADLRAVRPPRRPAIRLEAHLRLEQHPHRLRGSRARRLARARRGNVHVAVRLRPADDRGSPPKPARRPHDRHREREAEGGEEIPEHLLNGFFLLMVIAGNETTRNSLSGGMHALIEKPAERRKLEQNPSVLPTAIEEILRWVSPVNHMRRTATRDTEVRGVKIAAGDKVVLWYPAANRDPDAFDRPETFDVTRTPNDHLAFGIGEHFCLGAAARAPAAAGDVPGAAAPARGSVEMAGDVKYMWTNFINGIKAMPVRIPRELTGRRRDPRPRPPRAEPRGTPRDCLTRDRSAHPEHSACTCHCARPRLLR